MAEDTVVINKVENNIEALTNAIYLNLEIHGVDHEKRWYMRIGDKIHPVIHKSTLDDRTIQMNSIQRRENDRSLVRVRHLKDVHLISEEEMKESHKQVSVFTAFVLRIFRSNKGDGFYSAPDITREDITAQIRRQLQRIHFLRNNQSYLISLTIGCDEIHCQIKTNSPVYSSYCFYDMYGKTKIDVVNQCESQIKIRDQNLFKFDDILEMGVGGLSSQFEELFRRAFASRTLDPMVATAIGVEHVRGIMLYGPPGCGKTLIARQISRSMNSIEPIIVNGPELMSKYVGESEENLRKVFEPAEKEYRIHKERSNLHVVIFDEIDSICTHRGSNSGSTGVGDRIVNQLLTKLDGVNELKNILVIGLTNRIDLIDKALLRPGRFEVKIEIGLPDKQGRTEILNIHTEKLRKNQCFDPSISIEELAELTANYTGAELKGLVNSARSYALCRAIDEDDLKNKKSTKSAKKSKSSNPHQNLKLSVTYTDLMMAMREVRPAFGQDQVISGIETGLGAYGIYEFIPGFLDAYRELSNRLQRFESSRSNIAVIALSGSKGSGKTTLALDIARRTKFPMVRFVDQSKFVGLNEYTLSAKLGGEFEEISNSQRGVIVLDDLERLIGFTNPHRVRESIVASLLTMVDKLEKIGQDRKYVIIITGTQDVVNYITDKQNNLIDPRSVKGHIKLPELPLITKDMNNKDVCDFGYENYDEYLGLLRQIQTKISSTTNMKLMRISHHDVFDLHEGEEDLPSSIPIKYYIEFYNDALIRYSEEVRSEE